MRPIYLPTYLVPYETPQKKTFPKFPIFRSFPFPPFSTERLSFDNSEKGTNLRETRRSERFFYFWQEQKKRRGRGGGGVR